MARPASLRLLPRGHLLQRLELFRGGPERSGRILVPRVVGKDRLPVGDRRGKLPAAERRQRFLRQRRGGAVDLRLPLAPREGIAPPVRRRVGDVPQRPHPSLPRVFPLSLGVRRVTALLEGEQRAVELPGDPRVARLLLPGAGEELESPFVPALLERGHSVAEQLVGRGRLLGGGNGGRLLDGRNGGRYLGGRNVGSLHDGRNGRRSPGGRNGGRFSGRSRVGG